MVPAAFLAVIWSFLTAAAVTTCVRVSQQGPPTVDGPLDYVLSLFAFLVFIATCATNTVLSLEHRDMRLSQGLYNVHFASTTLYLTGLWCLKASLLLTFRSLARSSSVLKKAWDLAFTVMISSYACCVLSYSFMEPACLSGRTSLPLSYLSLIRAAVCTDRPTLVSMTSLWITTSWDVASNALLILLPLTIFMGAGLPEHLKNQAVIRYSSIAIVVCLSVLRASGSYAIPQASRALWLHLWGTVQTSVFTSMINILAVRAHRVAIRSQIEAPSMGITEPVNEIITSTRDSQPPLETTTVQPLQSHGRLVNSTPPGIASRFSWTTSYATNDTAPPSFENYVV